MHHVCVWTLSWSNLPSNALAQIGATAMHLSEYRGENHYRRLPISHSAKPKRHTWCENYFYHHWWCKAVWTGSMTGGNEGAMPRWVGEVRRLCVCACMCELCTVEVDWWKFHFKIQCIACCSEQQTCTKLHVYFIALMLNTPNFIPEMIKVNLIYRVELFLRFFRKLDCTE